MTMESHSVEPFNEVLRELAAIKQGLVLQSLPAIPLDAFLDMLLDVYNFKLPKRTAQDMIADGRIPIIPKLRLAISPRSIWCAGAIWPASQNSISSWSMRTPAAGWPAVP